MRNNRTLPTGNFDSNSSRVIFTAASICRWFSCSSLKKVSCPRRRSWSDSLMDSNCVKEVTLLWMDGEGILGSDV